LEDVVVLTLPILSKLLSLIKHSKSKKNQNLHTSIFKKGLKQLGTLQRMLGLNLKMRLSLLKNGQHARQHFQVVNFQSGLKTEKFTIKQVQS